MLACRTPQPCGLSQLPQSRMSLLWTVWTPSHKATEWPVLSQGLLPPMLVSTGWYDPCNHCWLARVPQEKQLAQHFLGDWWHTACMYGLHGISSWSDEVARCGLAEPYEKCVQQAIPLQTCTDSTVISMGQLHLAQLGLEDAPCSWEDLCQEAHWPAQVAQHCRVHYIVGGIMICYRTHLLSPVQRAR